MYEQHNFYCLKCGAKSIPLPRKKGKQYKKFHRKKLYCYKCNLVINHIECRNEQEEEEFKEKFENGDFLDETREELNYIQQRVEGF